MKMFKDKSKLFLIFPFTISVLLYVILLILSGVLIGNFRKGVEYLEPENTFKIEEVEQEVSFVETKTEILPQTGENDIWINFKNSQFSFDYPENLQVRNLADNLCQGESCKWNNREVTRIGNLYVSTFSSNLALDFDYDKGLDNKLFKEPMKTIIDGREFYYIVSKEGNLEMIVGDYKIVNDTLWVKTDYRVIDQGYYISFDRGVFYGIIPEEKLSDYDAIFQTFKF